MIEGVTVDVTRLRLSFEASHAHEFASGGTLTPSVELGLRHDGGDGETGTGMELGGRLRYLSQGLTIEGERSYRLGSRLEVGPTLTMGLEGRAA